MAIQIKSFNQLLGNMVRRIIANTPISDLHTGSVLLTLLEAAATNDFENNVAILNILELLNINALKNSDLDARAADFGLSRHSATRASGFVQFQNTLITKRSTSLYPIKPAPIAGATQLYVTNAANWNPTGSLFIGRGTSNFEGPINYSSITDNVTFYTIQLSAALQKNHLISDQVIDAQGQTDRVIPAGTSIKIPANNQSPAIQYSSLRDSVIPAGENTTNNVEAVAAQTGSNANAGIGTISEFVNMPFSGAAVINISPLTNGRDIETDLELRERIKTYTLTLARGTKSAVLSSLIGLYDSSDNKGIASAVVTEPTQAGYPSLLYIDDGSGFQPSYTGQSVDALLDDASGKEEFLQLANFPLPRPQVISASIGPYALLNGMFLRVRVDSSEETVTFSTSDFVNIAAATLAEIVAAINSQAYIFKARLTENSTCILLYANSFNAEIIQIMSLQSNEDVTLFANDILKFPTNEFSHIRLYQNGTLLSEKAKAATLVTTLFSSWNISTDSSLSLSVDNTPAQTYTFTTADFGGSSFSSLTLSDWTAAFNQKFAGVKAEALSSGRMQLVSNNVSSTSALKILGGTLYSKWFTDLLIEDSGKTSEFELNRQNGNVRILTTIEAHDDISAGVEDAKGSAISAATLTGFFNVSTDASGRPATLVIIPDADRVQVRSISLGVGARIAVSSPAANVMRLMASSISAFLKIMPTLNDYIFIAPRTTGWLDPANTGIFKVIAKGGHTLVGVDTYIDVLNYQIGSFASSPYTIAAADDIQAFYSTSYPQAWYGNFVTNPPSAAIQDIVDSINDNLINVKASIFKNTQIKITSITESGGSIAIPVISGNAITLFDSAVAQQSGNPPHIATRLPQQSTLSLFKRTQPITTGVWLGRSVYSDIRGAVTTSAAPGDPAINTFGEILESTGLFNPINDVNSDDLIIVTRGDNRGHYRTIRQILSNNIAGTEFQHPNTLLDYIASYDEIGLAESLQFSDDDTLSLILDNDATNNQFNIALSRLGKVNSGSQATSFIPNNTALSADDADNEAGIDFGTLSVWSKTLQNTEFQDYRVWFRARNWYATGGATSGGAQFIVRAEQYGPSGEKMQFALDYPSTANKLPSTAQIISPTGSIFKYVFGSDAPRTINLTDGMTIDVSQLTTTTFSYLFSPGADFSSVLVGDILSILPNAGVSTSNRGQFYINAVNSIARTIEVYNPNGSPTTVGAAEVSSATTIGDTVGSKAIVNITTSSAALLDGKYFVLYGTGGSVAFWYQLNPLTPEPSHGATRSVKIAVVGVADDANTVAAKTASIIATDPEFSATNTPLTSLIVATNTINGVRTSGSAGTSGFVFAQISNGTNDVSLTGKYFTLQDQNGSVAFWFDVNNVGTLEPLHGADRSVRIASVISGDNANAVAAKVNGAINADTQFTSTVLANVATITDIVFGNRSTPSAGTSGFALATVTNGSSGVPEIITAATSISVFPLNGTDVTTIEDTVNATEIVKVTAVGSGALTIVRATREEQYTPAGPSDYSQSLSWGHDPVAINGKYESVSLVDGETWVLKFSNDNPNFTLKKALVLPGIAPSVYAMDTAPNQDNILAGEFFKLIPSTIENTQHQLTHRALSQLSILASADIANNVRDIQLKSFKLGSNGAVEVVGGEANATSLAINGDTQMETQSGQQFMRVSLPAFPNTLQVGDSVKLYNSKGVDRLTRLSDSDSINVVAMAGNFAEYRYNPKISWGSSIAFTIADQSSTYSKPAGTVWRWTHTGTTVDLQFVLPGDTLYAFGPLAGWSAGNRTLARNNSLFPGLVVVSVNSTSKYIDVVNPWGVVMGSTVLGALDTVHITPTPRIEWPLKHAAPTHIVSVIVASGVATMDTSEPHRLDVGDSITVLNNGVAPTSAVLTTDSSVATRFTYSTVASDGLYYGGTVTKIGSTTTRYRVEKTPIRDLMRLVYVDGVAPRFLDFGGAVDDLLWLSGNTFNSNNNGVFRIKGITNTAILFENSVGAEELHTSNVQFNDINEPVNWVQNSSVISGPSGAFVNVSIGDAVKKQEDSDVLYVHVTAKTATSLSLDALYQGTTSLSTGVKWNTVNDVEKGVYLYSEQDVRLLEGDAVRVDDSLFIADLINTAWFQPNNSGTFAVQQIGVSDDFKPFIRISNSVATSEINRLMSANPNGILIKENNNARLESTRKVVNIVRDLIDDNLRVAYLTPADRIYKFSESNDTALIPMGKLNYSTDIISGVDGYQYYTGLMRTAQRTIDGFEPDATSYPGRRAIGGLIELLPPLIRRVRLSLKINTNEGVNVGEISNEIKATIVDYIASLGVGEDVILSQIIARVMAIRGVAAATLLYPSYLSILIPVFDDEKAYIEVRDIAIA